MLITATIRDNESPPPGVDYVPADITTDSSIAAGDSWINDKTVHGRIEYHYDTDWYKTTLTQGQCYQIEIRGLSDEEWNYPGTNSLDLLDPELYGVYHADEIHHPDGVYLPGTYNDNGGTGNSALHTLRFNKTGTYYIAASHGADGGSRFDVSIIDLGTVTKTCTEVDVDNLTYVPGVHDGT